MVSMKAMHSLYACISIILFVMCLNAQALELMVDDFENGVGAWNHYPYSYYPYGKDIFENSGDFPYNGTNSMHMTFRYGREGKLFHGVETLSPTNDLTQWDTLSCWCRAGDDYGPQTYWAPRPSVGAKLMVVENSGELWYPEPFVYLSTNWTKVEYAISQFSTRETEAPYDNGIFNPEDIAKIRVVVYASGSSTVNKDFYVDDVYLSKWVPPPADLLDDFEEGVNLWSSWPGFSNFTAIAYETDPANVKVGSGSMKFSYLQGLDGPQPGHENEYYRRYATVTRAPYWTNYTAYTGISYWIKSEHNDTNRIHLVVMDGNSVKWEHLNRIAPTTGWQQVNAYFEQGTLRGFDRMEGGNPSSVMDISSITQIQFRVDKEMYGVKGAPEYSNTVFYIDDIRLITNAPPTFTPEAEPVLLNFENNDIGLWERFSKIYTTMDHVSDNPHSGNHCLALRYEQAVHGSNYAEQLATAFHPNPHPDWTGYTQIVAWVKESQYSTNTFGIMLTETNGQQWIQRVKLETTDTWQQVKLPLLSKWDDGLGFDPAGWGEGTYGTNIVLDLDMIDKIGFEFSKGTMTNKSPAWTTLYVDDIELSTDPLTPYASITIAGDSIGFGEIQGNKDLYRFVTTNSATLNWITSGMDDVLWGLYVYSTDPQGKAGLKGVSDPDQYLPARWWTGPNKATPPPDPMVISIWTNEFGHVLDENDPNIRAMLTSQGPVAAGAVGSLELHFAVDLGLGIAPQDYSSILTVELRVDE